MGRLQKIRTARRPLVRAIDTIEAARRARAITNATDQEYDEEKQAIRDAIALLDDYANRIEIPRARALPEPSFFQRWRKLLFQK